MSLRSILLSVAILAPYAAYAEPAVAESPAQATAIAAQKCAKGCMILSPEDVATLEGSITEFAQRAYIAGAQEGFEAGTKEGIAAAKANPKICPRNI